ncbi:GNAT family N-acetyltransferase [Aurantimonas sp. MSK8Z-1]|uniref:GNAT family N-acetyltransferase n=1 Tax=Mangrovibrevibacter kandeliae TaxID=2968473 RepID=UPI0021190363|nr:GNAT family N-acetyltransferase [Aurantimonas sp. MSK8Z-1]MCW4116743.1 GNAT family N-acetyltransferase [Aurantimonas sp. MSK8Z-1]
MAAVEPVTLRRAGAEDAEAVAALTRAAYAKWIAVIGREPLPMLADHAAAIRDHRVDLLTADGVLAGLIETAERPDHLLIVSVAVAPELQRRGFARQLLAHAEALAGAAGRPEIRLYTNAAFAANVALYRRCGYAVSHEEPFRGGTTVHMKKVIGVRRD